MSPHLATNAIQANIKYLTNAGEDAAVTAAPSEMSSTFRFVPETLWTAAPRIGFGANFAAPAAASAPTLLGSKRLLLQLLDGPACSCAGFTPHHTTPHQSPHHTRVQTTPESVLNLREREGSLFQRENRRVSQ